MRYIFEASRLSGKDNAVFPDQLIIDDEAVTYRKGRVIGYKETRLRYQAIGCVSLSKHLLFSDIIIETNGGMVIQAKGFSTYEAEEIVELIESMS